MLQVDATPTSSSVTSFALGVPEFEQVAHQDDGRKKKPDGEKAKKLRMKRFEARRDMVKEKTGGGEKEKEQEMPKCRFFLTDQGCRRCKECGFSHEQKDEKRRCWNCDAIDHFSNSCPRKYGSLNEGSPPKLKSSERST